MTAFQLDTSGEVALPWHGWGDKREPVTTWGKLTPFTQGYIEALLEAAGDAIFLRINGAQDFAFSDIAPATLARIMADCFQWADRFGPDWPDAASGCDFWSERQAERWESEGFPPLHIYLGDDGLIHHRETNP